MERGGREEGIKKPTFSELLAKTGEEMVQLYAKTLRLDAEDEQRAFEEDFLSEGRKELLNKHLEELDQLVEMFERLKSGALFDPVVRVRKRFEGGNGSRETTTVRLAPRGQKLLGPRLQLSFYVNTGFLESGSEQMEAIAKKGKPTDRVLEEYFNKAESPVISVNTVLVSGDREGRTVMSPQAGISFRLFPEEKDIRVGGEIYVGRTRHTTELSETVSHSFFLTALNGIEKLFTMSSPRRSVIKTEQLPGS